jgi:flagellin-like hook-associated protein FlgL
MTLTLGNDLTGLVSREVTAAESKTRGLGASLTTGNDVFVEVVDAFLGNSLRDGEILLGAIAKNTAYGVNLLTITDEYLKTIASLLQDSLKIISSAGSLSTDKLAVLQKSLNDKKAQVNLLINTASFDGKSLLKGDVMDMEIQIGLNVDDRLKIKVNDISNGKLFRSSITNTINNWIAEDHARCVYYNSESEMKQDLARNLSLIDVAGKRSGSGTGGHFTIAHLATAIISLRDNDPSFLSLLNETLPETISALKAIIPYDTNRNLANVNIGQLSTALSRIPGQNGAKREVLKLLYDNSSINLSSNYGTTEIALAKNIYTTALATIRVEQARVANQKQNLLSAADALRATTNVTQKASDSYLKTDYVLTAQQYSETIRTMVAAITSLQAANKIPEAAQRLMEALAR